MAKKSGNSLDSKYCFEYLQYVILNRTLYVNYTNNMSLSGN